MPRIQYTFLDPALVPITVPAPGFAADSCGAAAAGGGAPGTGGYTAAQNSGNPQRNLRHLRFWAGASTPADDLMGYFDANGPQWNAAITAACAAYPITIGLPGGWVNRNLDLRRSIAYACRRPSMVGGISQVAGTPIIDYLAAGGGAWTSRLETNERIGLSYFMGVLFHFLTLQKAGYSFVLHTKLLDLAAQPVAAVGLGFGQGSQYLAGNKPDFISCTPIIPAPGGGALPGRIHILEAKGRMQRVGVALVGARGILSGAMDQCLRYQGFRLPAGGIAMPGGLGGWGPAGVFFAAPGGNVIVNPTSRVATLGAWNRPLDRWQLWVVDPEEDSLGAGAEFTDGFMRLFYAQYKAYFDQAEKTDLETVTYQNITFETAAVRGLEMRIGIDERILNLLRNEPQTGYSAGYITEQISTFMADYADNKENEYDAFVSKEGIYSANLTPNPPNNANRVTPPAA